MFEWLAAECFYFQRSRNDHIYIFQCKLCLFFDTLIYFLIKLLIGCFSDYGIFDFLFVTSSRCFIDRSRKDRSRKICNICMLKDVKRLYLHISTLVCKEKDGYTYSSIRKWIFESILKVLWKTMRVKVQVSSYDHVKSEDTSHPIAFRICSRNPLHSQISKLSLS